MEQKQLEHSEQQRPKPEPGRTPSLEGELDRMQHKTEEEIDEVVEESFPASDPPSWSGGSASRSRRREGSSS
jgi:hypothetical protein